MISICYWLRKMIADLSEKVVLLVILDGLVFFTQSTEQSEETKLLISSLVSIFRGRRKATLKFMFSSPVRLDFIEDLFLDSELLDLPRSIATNQLIDKLEKKSL